MNTINKQLDEELFENYYILRLRLRPHPHLLPRLHLRLRPHLRLRLHPHLRPRLSDKVFNQLDNLYIGWDYGDSVLNILKVNLVRGKWAKQQRPGPPS